jgi:hypothetical protein
MKLRLVVFSFFLVGFSFAKDLPKMKPGLWNIEMSIKGENGKEINPTAAIQSALAKIPEAQRKKMTDMMGQFSAPKTEGNGMDVCYTQDMLKDPSSIAKHDQGRCESTLVSKTDKEVKTNFKCKDGTTGDANWKVLSDSKYEGEVNINSPKRGKSKMSYKANFKTKDCGKVKPRV